MSALPFGPTLLSNVDVWLLGRPCYDSVLEHDFLFSCAFSALTFRGHDEK